LKQTGKGKGTLQISYNSLDELEGILEHIKWPPEAHFWRSKKSHADFHNVRALLYWIFYALIVWP
jgi:hypothetical protein